MTMPLRGYSRLALVILFLGTVHASSGATLEHDPPAAGPSHGVPGSVLRQNAVLDSITQVRDLLYDRDRDGIPDDCARARGVSFTRSAPWSGRKFSLSRASDLALPCAPCVYPRTVWPRAAIGAWIGCPDDTPDASVALFTETGDSLAHTLKSTRVGTEYFARLSPPHMWTTDRIIVRIILGPDTLYAPVRVRP
jgi:hypothetical protein